MVTASFCVLIFFLLLAKRQHCLVSEMKAGFVVLRKGKICCESFSSQMFAQIAMCLIMKG
jgi:hypothetical protein